MVQTSPKPIVEFSVRESRHVSVIDVRGDLVLEHDCKRLLEKIRELRRARKRRIVLNFDAQGQISGTTLKFVEDAERTTREQHAHLYLTGLGELARLRLKTARFEFRPSVLDTPDEAISAMQTAFQVHNITARMVSDVALVDLEGRLYSEDDGDLLLEFLETLLSAGVRKIVVCVTQRIIHEGVCGDIFSALKLVESRGAVLKLVLTAEQPRGYWRSMHLDSVIPVYLNEADAIAGFRR